MKIQENILLVSQKYLKQKKYWVTKLKEPIQSTFLLEANSLQPNSTPSVCDINLSSDIIDKLINASKGSHLSIYVLLLSNLKILISKYTGNNHTSVFSPIYFGGTDIENTINEGVLQLDHLIETDSFKTFLFKVKQTFLN